MATYFLDSSALVKHYHAEGETAEVDRLLEEPSACHFISRLTVVEVQSAFIRKVREGKISLMELDVVRQRFLDDITQRRVQFKLSIIPIAFKMRCDSTLRSR